MKDGPLRQLLRKLYWLPHDLRVLSEANWPQELIYFGGDGFGDDLLLTSVAMELHRSGVKRVAVITKRTELFEHCPFPITVLNADRWSTLDAMLRWGRRAVKPHYYRGFREPDTDVIGPYHIIAEMCRQVGVRRRIELKPHFHLLPEERKRGALVERQVVIQCTSHLSSSPSRLKYWIEERHQEVVDRLRGQYNFVQLGSAGDPPLREVVDLRGKTSMRQSAAVLANSVGMIGYVGFLMHLARAVECRSVIIFGGREHPSESGYICNENLFTALPCSPCWHRTLCEFGRECMWKISSADVADAFGRLVARAGQPLETQYQEVA